MAVTSDETRTAISYEIVRLTSHSRRRVHSTTENLLSWPKYDLKVEITAIKPRSSGLLRNEYAKRIVCCVFEVSGISSVFYDVLLVNVQ